jgi:hypothetical protein
MQTLSFQDCASVSGGLTGEQVIVGAAALIGGAATYQAASYLSPLYTLMGTVGTATTLGTVCSFFAPGVGTVLCGTSGALLGYAFSSTIASVGAFGLGAAATGYVASRSMS